MVMGETAELLGRHYGITREESDCFSLESLRKASIAIDAGYFVREIAPITVTVSGRPTVMDRDEHLRRNVTLESLRQLPPVFETRTGQPGIITAGSSCGITDGGAALVLASAEHARSNGLTARARIVGWATAGVDPRIMGIGAVPAMQKLTARTGLKGDDFDLVEINEAFAPQVLAVLKDVPVSGERLNVNGGAIALGHPVGCTGARIVVTLLHELERRKVQRGLVTLCVSGGMGMAMAIERI
jgi:acetyl-CoA C-acetyltransferase